LFTRRSLKAFCNVLQEKVADRVPERVVDVFEPVEIEEQKGKLCPFDDEHWRVPLTIDPSEESD
jgi:hypothetical protein